MSGPIYSDDGHWMWNGTEWIPATQAQNAVPAQQIDQAVVANAATQVGVPAQQVAAVAPHFDLNQDGQIDQNEMMQAAQSVSNPVNVPAPNQANMGMPVQGGAMPNMGGMGMPVQGIAGTPKKVFDWKDKKIMLIGGIITITVAMGILVFFLLSGNPIVGTWVTESEEVTYNKDGTFSNGGDELPGVTSLLWEIEGDKLIQTSTTASNDMEMTVTQTAKFELTDNNNVLWIDIISMVDENGTNLLVNPFDGSPLDLPCILVLNKNIAEVSTFNTTATSYQSSKPSWCV